MKKEVQLICTDPFLEIRPDQAAVLIIVRNLSLKKSDAKKAADSRRKIVFQRGILPAWRGRADRLPLKRGTVEPGLVKKMS